MTRVITYGTYDLLHYGHIRLLERAKKLGDYLIVGVTSDDYDKSRGKINVHQSLMERIEAVKATGLADQIIVEEYAGQKIDDIRRFDVDIFAIGSDWQGQFDYLTDYCDVVYLERTRGVSSSEIRSKEDSVRIGFMGNGNAKVMEKHRKECAYVNGAEVVGVYTEEEPLISAMKAQGVYIAENYDDLLERCDAVYVCSYPSEHYKHIRRALEKGKHVLCESPIALSAKEVSELYELADSKNLILSEAIKTAYSTAYNRLMLLIKSGMIGAVLSIDATSTSLREQDITEEYVVHGWNSICKWGPAAMLPVFQIFGTDYEDAVITSLMADSENKVDAFTQIFFRYAGSVASVKVGMGVKSEGELVISGTKGYIYVPAPWWKPDYFEVRFERSEENKRYFYQLDGEGIRYEIVAFLKAIHTGKNISYIDRSISEGIAEIIDRYYSGKQVHTLHI